jgi:N-methylhydantoinase A/oxoprolinase/acetone carboxylase beta subunit
MPVLLGIDTGGTYTDAVLLDDEKGILRSAKSLTTRDDLTVGIAGAMRQVLPEQIPPIHLVSLSSTLATNAIVEGKGSPACLILLGYDPELLSRDDFRRIPRENPVVFLKGGHTLAGKEQEPLDKRGVRQAAAAYASSVSAFAVSGYFSVRNASHELAAREIIRDLTGLPVTCGHELTSHLNAPLRAMTVLLNARLIPLMHDLIIAVQKVLADLKIVAPLMIVKGDGSLIASEMALERPIETIVSGPAASMVGARYLSGYDDALVIDMGGTTSDIALMREGFPLLSEYGLSVNGFRPMVSSIDVRTEGIGGDSEIRFDDTQRMQIGPRRVIPLSLLGSEFPPVVETLKRFKGLATRQSCRDMRFLMRSRSIPKSETLSPLHQEILKSISDQPVLQMHLLEQSRYPTECRYGIDDLVDRGILAVSSFTPTDAVQVLGFYEVGSREAALHGSELFAAGYGFERDELCRAVFSQVIFQLGRALIMRMLTAEGERLENPGFGEALIERALREDEEGLLAVTFSLRLPIVAVGAPVTTYLPSVAEVLNCPIGIPDYAAVANAVGAVVGSVFQSVRILIKPHKGGTVFRVHLPEGIRDFKSHQRAVEYAREHSRILAEEHALRAGAGDIETRVEIRELVVNDAVSGERVRIETEIVAAAIGRPEFGK